MTREGYDNVLARVPVCDGRGVTRFVRSRANQPTSGRGSAKPVTFAVHSKRFDTTKTQSGQRDRSNSGSPSQWCSAGRGAVQSRVVTSWTSHVLPSGSAKYKNDL
jgi:hypothetical protein